MDQIVSLIFCSPRCHLAKAYVSSAVAEDATSQWKLAETLHFLSVIFNHNGLAVPSAVPMSETQI